MVDTTPRSYIYGMLIFMFIIVGGVSLLSEFRSADPSFDNSSKTREFNDTFNKLDSISGEINSMQNNIENAQSDYGAFGVLNSLISSSWSGIKLIGSSLSFMDGAFNGMNKVFGVPTWISSIIILFVSVTLIFAIYRMIFQSE